MKKNILVILLISCYCSAKAQQIIENPAAAEQSHQELSIIRIAIFSDSTVFELSIENKRDQRRLVLCRQKNLHRKPEGP